MKISPKKYAQALFLSLKDKSNEESIEVINRFVELLKDHHQLGASRKIVFYLDKLYQSTGLSWPVTIQSAHKLSSDNKKIIINFLKNKAKGAELDLQEEIKPELLAGIILRYQDKIYDASFKTRLNNFNKEINK
jgi:ATP synthase F1 delta subunit